MELRAVIRSLLWAQRRQCACTLLQAPLHWLLTLPICHVWNYYNIKINKYVLQLLLYLHLWCLASSYLGCSKNHPRLGKLKTQTENDVKKSRFIAKMSHKSKPHLVGVLSWERISKWFWNANLVLKFWPTVVSLLRDVLYICGHMKTCWEGFEHGDCIFLIKSLRFCWPLGQYTIPIQMYVHLLTVH